MTRLRTIASRVWSWLRQERLDGEFDEELTTHVELLVDEYRRSGMTDADARREALRKLGRPVTLREDHRAQRGLPLLDIFTQDIRHAVRMVRKNPAFTLVVTLSLALGIGANTALFSLVDDLLLRSLPVREPDRLVQVQHDPGMMMGIRKPRLQFPKPVFDAIRQESRVVSEVVGFASLPRPLVTIDGVTETNREVEEVSENFFRDLGVTPTVGRTPEPSDGAVAIISHRMWRARFNGSASVLGRPLTVEGRAHTIIGVAPAGFLGLSIDVSPDLWISARPDAQLQMLARLSPAIAIGQAQAAMDPLIPQLQNAPAMHVALLPAGKGLSRLREQYERPLLALTVLAVLVLLVTCTNVGHLLMVRNLARRRELMVRVALGAPRSRLMLQSLVESALVGALGGVLALVLARWGVTIILSMLPLPAVPDRLAFQADARVLGFTAGVSLLGVLLFGVAPAWRAAQVDLHETVKASTGTTPATGARRLGRSLVACQVALSILLLVGAGLFVQTLRNLARFDVGFTPDHLLQVSLDTRGSGYRDGQVGALYRLMLERVGAIPGVRSVTAIRNAVMQGGGSRMSVRAFRERMRGGGDNSWDSAEVGLSFFETMNISVVRGRTFTDADFERTREERPLVVISEAFAKHYFPNEDPVDLTVGGITIIGIVRDAKLTQVRQENGPMMYEMMRWEPDRVSALEVRAAGEPAAIARAVGAEIRRINPRLLLGIRTMREEIDRMIARERMVAATSGFFSLLGLLLVSVGIFGVASYSVAQRTNELGIRMALGAGRWSVVRESLRESMLVFGVGLAAGVLAAVAGVRLAAGFIAELLFGLTPTDAVNLAAAVFLIVVVAAAACVLPARRATRVDVLTAIRAE